VELDRSTLADWVGGTSKLLQPLVGALRRQVMSAEKLHADDTPVPVLAPGNGKTKTGRLWTYVRDDRPAGGATPPAVWFAYTPDRKGEHPKAHLKEFTGTLQADGYAGYDQVYEGGRIQEAGCMAHVRQKFYDLHVAHNSPVAAEALERIGALYALEKEIRGRSPAERREMFRLNFLDQFRGHDGTSFRLLEGKILHGAVPSEFSLNEKEISNFHQLFTHRRCWSLPTCKIPIEWTVQKRVHLCRIHLLYRKLTIHLS
jgi:hypothetical protein